MSTTKKNIGEYQIPRKFKFSHRYSWFLYNNITRSYNTLIKRKVFETGVTFKRTNEMKEYLKLDKDESLNWLKQNYPKKHSQIIFNTVIPYIIEDMLCHIYEALVNSEKGNLGITFTLLRKPLKDNLLIVEWFLYNYKEFYEIFINEEPKKYSPADIEKLKIIEIVKGAVGKLSGDAFINEETIYNLRYNKDDDFTLNMIWQNSSHLVTTRHTRSKTEKMGFNFLFMGKNEKEELWEGLYARLPYLLYYISEVQAELFNFDKLFQKEKNYDVYNSRKVFGLLA